MVCILPVMLVRVGYVLIDAMFGLFLSGRFLIVFFGIIAQNTKNDNKNLWLLVALKY